MFFICRQEHRRWSRYLLWRSRCPWRWRHRSRSNLLV